MFEMVWGQGKIARKTGCSRNTRISPVVSSSIGGDTHELLQRGQRFAGTSRGIMALPNASPMRKYVSPF
jgi:hypothetical protein